LNIMSGINRSLLENLGLLNSCKTPAIETPMFPWVKIWWGTSEWVQILCSANEALLHGTQETWSVGVVYLFIYGYFLFVCVFFVRSGKQWVGIHPHATSLKQKVLTLFRWHTIEAKVVTLFLIKIIIILNK
jgi:hypothetical protein